MTNCRLTDPEFERGVKDFLAVCNVVKVFRHTRILQIAPRPFDFWSTMCNEGELLEKFNIQLSPIPLPELTAQVKKAKEEGTEVKAVMDYCKEKMNVCVTEEQLENIAALKVAMRRLADQYGCNAVAIQCWNALQGELGIMPCAANSLLNEEGLPVVCETDIHGAITAVMAEAADLNRIPSFFADWTVRHPDNENGELVRPALDAALLRGHRGGGVQQGDFSSHAQEPFPARHGGGAAPEKERGLEAGGGNAVHPAWDKINQAGGATYASGTLGRIGNHGKGPRGGQPLCGADIRGHLHRQK